MLTLSPRFQQVVCIVAAIALVGTEAPLFAADPTCVGDCDASNAVSAAELITLIEGVLAGQAPTTCGVTVDAAMEQVVQAVNHAVGGCPVAGTPTLTPTPTETPTMTPTLDLSAPLGTRRFNVSSANGGFFASVEGITLRLGGFMGQTNGVKEQAFLEFEAGVPDPTTQIASINVTKASEYLVAEAPQANVVFCLQLQTPIINAGAIDCDGGSDFSIRLLADHRLGELGVGGFTAAQCTSMGGEIESSNQLCKTGLEFNECHANSDCDTIEGAGDGKCGLTSSRCAAGTPGGVCDNDSDCDSAPGTADGRCGQMLPHIGVCNGPFTPIIGSGNSGPGSVSFAPIPGFLEGLPAKLSIEQELPCGDEAGGQQLSFALTSASARATIEDVNNMAGHALNFALTQTSSPVPKLYELQNFSCQDWKNTAGPGCLGLVAPAFHQFNGADIVTSFKLCGR